MSNNNHFVAGAALTAALGTTPWAAVTSINTAGTLTNTDTVNFRWETHSSTAKQVRLTLTGQFSVTVTGAGWLAYNVTIPFTQLPKWARPQDGGSVAAGSVGGGTIPCALIGAPFSCSISADASQMRIAIRAPVVSGTLSATASPMNAVLTYIAR